MANMVVRIGIDVGGTYTKAVAIDNIDHKILGKASVKTTHRHPMGVSAGIVEAFLKCLSENNIAPEEVVFIAHSTTQATNALLEGDVAKVGVLGMSKKGIEAFLAKGHAHIKDIILETGKHIQVFNGFTTTNKLDEEQVKKSIEVLLQSGAQVVVASKAFGVDNAYEEEMVQKVGAQLNVPVTKASDISKLYGLNIRTRTAVINASILPKMLDTAASIEMAVKDNGIRVPLMIMRGDGGVMDINEMKRRPVLTMLSGPAASVVGALMFLRASNGIYFEVGGTSTNIGVIKNGRPMVDYSMIGGHRTFVSSLDVRVLGIAGGSMVRVKDGKLVDVGPRSAHIAGYDYCAFTPEEKMVNPEIEYIRPKPEDPDDYVTVRVKSGERYAITNTCAANALGYVCPEWFAHGNRESCVKAIQVLADVMGVSMEDCATQILDNSFGKIKKTVEALSEKYSLEREQTILVGCGGGAGALLPYSAKMLDMDFSIPEQAEVISSIGVALAMVRDVVERMIVNPSAQDIADIKKEAVAMAVNGGAVEDTVEVVIEIDPTSNKVTAIALGSSEVKTTDLLKSVTEDEALELACGFLGGDPDKIQLEGKTAGTFIFCAPHKSKPDVKSVCIVDKKGFSKAQGSDTNVLTTVKAAFGVDLQKVWTESLVFASDAALYPDIFLCVGNRVIECSGMQTVEQVANILASDLEFVSGDEPIVIVAVKKQMRF
ncbi:MAG: hydantoinase/oxoprolinase family protein [Oscillospiraceae bacterium]|nr:hydantoinase/oxoprolinase family protein [Oscillospiraceae bacterium]